MCIRDSYTPNDPFGDAPQSFVNVIEDARIERMMKDTYPGLRKSFFDGYTELWNDDFFGVKHEDLETLPLIDRINLYFKGNSSMPFNEDEQVWVEKVSNTKTFKDVVDLANEMYGHAQKIEDAKPKVEDDDLSQFDFPFDSEEGDDGEETSMNQETDTEGQGQDTQSVPQPSSKQTDTTETSDDQPVTTKSVSPIGGGQIASGHDETKSITEEALSQALETLIDEDAKEWVYLTLPQIKLDDIIIPSEEITEGLKFHFYGQAFGNKESLDNYMGNVDFQVDNMNHGGPIDDPRIDHILEHQHNLEAKLDELLAMAHSHHDGDHQHPEPPPVLYEGHVVLHPTSPPPPEAYDTATGA